MIELIAMFLVAFVIVAGVAMRILKWLEDGGLYYMKYPAAKVMDDAKKNGQSVDYRTALKAVESSKSRR